MASSSSSSTVVCANCKSPLEGNDVYSCSCGETGDSVETGTLKQYCDICILGHIKAKHVVTDKKGSEVAVCSKHLLIPYCYCHTDRKLTCIRCSCPELGHKFVNIPDEGRRCRKEVFGFCNELENKEKELKSRKKHYEDMLLKFEKEREEFRIFVHDVLMEIEAMIMKSVNKDQENIKKTNNEAETCISETLEFQAKMRSFLAHSDGALIENFYESKNDVVNLIEKQKKLINLIYSFKSHVQLFNSTNFVQKTANDFLEQVKLPSLQQIVSKEVKLPSLQQIVSKEVKLLSLQQIVSKEVKLPSLQQIVSKDITEKPDCEIEDLDVFQKQLEKSAPVNYIYRPGSIHFAIKQPNNSHVWDFYDLICTQVASCNVATTEVITSKVRINAEKSSLSSVRTNLASTPISMHYNGCWIVVFEKEDYCVCRKYQNLFSNIKTGQVGYRHSLLPVRVDYGTYGVEWVYWDEAEKAVRVSGKDGIKIPFEEKPIHVQLSSIYRGIDKYYEFVLVNKNWDVLVVDPEAADYLTTISQDKHTLRRIDWVRFDRVYLQLFDFDSNRLSEYRYQHYSEMSSVCHWRGKNSVVADPHFGRRLCASFNVGTPEYPKMQCMVLPFKK